jgi:hypothetical protein
MKRARLVWFGCGVLWLVAHAASATMVPTGAGCARSAEDAIARMLDGVHANGGKDGFRVVAVRTDPLRKRTWAMVVSCTDAARPMVAIELAADFISANHAMPLQRMVKIGNRVAVVHDDDDSRMVVEGWAEDSGGIGDLIRVRMSRLSGDEADAVPVIRCRVVGEDVVEVVR